MTTEYIEDIKKYTSDVNEAAVASIVKFSEIALRSKVSRYVSVTDDAEINRVVEGFCAKKLGLDAATATEAVKAAGEKMKTDRPKYRVTVYYLVAEGIGTLGRLA